MKKAANVAKAARGWVGYDTGMPRPGLMRSKVKTNEPPTVSSQVWARKPPSERTKSSEFPQSATKDARQLHKTNLLNDMELFNQVTLVEGATPFNKTTTLSEPLSLKKTRPAYTSKPMTTPTQHKSKVLLSKKPPSKFIQPLPHRTKRLHHCTFFELRYTSAIILECARGTISNPISTFLPLALNSQRTSFNSGFKLALMTSNTKRLPKLSTIRRHVRTRMKAAFLEAAEEEGYTFGAPLPPGYEEMSPCDRQDFQGFEGKVICGSIYLEPMMEALTADWETLKEEVKKGLRVIKKQERDLDAEHALTPSQLERHFENWRGKLHGDKGDFDS